jgi:hypothetical protein
VSDSVTPPPVAEPSSPAGAPAAPRWRSRRTLIILATISIGWKVLVFTIGAALPRWLVSEGIDELPAESRAYGASARATAIALWNGPVERRGLIRRVRVVSVDSAGDSAGSGAAANTLPDGCDGRSARVRAYTYFAIPYSEVRTVCDSGEVLYRVLRRRPRRGG